MDNPEPWLRGSLPGVNTFVAPLFCSFQQAREDLARYTSGLTLQQVWATPHGFGSVDFHIRHIAGSTDRLMTYLEGKQLSETQMTALHRESMNTQTPLQELLDEMDAAFSQAEKVAGSLSIDTLTEPRGVGRKRLPTTVIGLLTHICEHTQRHVGQAISAAKLAREDQSAP